MRDESIHDGRRISGDFSLSKDVCSCSRLRCRFGQFGDYGPDGVRKPQQFYDGSMYFTQTVISNDCGVTPSGRLSILRYCAFGPRGAGFLFGFFIRGGGRLLFRFWHNHVFVRIQPDDC